MVKYFNINDLQADISTFFKKSFRPQSENYNYKKLINNTNLQQAKIELNVRILKPLTTRLNTEHLRYRIK